SPEARIADQFQSAKILANEGFLEEAKKMLREIVLADPHHVAARQKLEEIHGIELKQIFGEERKRRPVTGRGEDSARAPDPADADRVLRELDRDLNLSEGLSGLSLFQDRLELERFAERLDRDLSMQDRLDLGIGFLEMELYPVAARLFTSALREICLGELRDDEHLVSAAALLASALTMDGRAFEAATSLQPLLNDTELAAGLKLEIFYQMGRAYEALGQLPLASEWYRQISKTDPRYRDIEDRLLRS
ncbi:MAG: hypothetical protein ACXWP5_00840, partial [Bdellovibrionota bacterium]